VINSRSQPKLKLFREIRPNKGLCGSYDQTEIDMKLVRFGAAGTERQGLLDERDQIRDLTNAMANTDAPYLSDQYFAEIADLDPETLPKADSDARIGACVASVGNFIAVGLNYADHAEEAGMDLPTEPILFNKAPSCITGPNDNIRIPPNSLKTDWEVELAVVIGKKAEYLPETQAMDHVAGFCICNDISERSYQLERGGTWSKGKGCPTFGPLGPWLVTRDSVDLSDLKMTLRVNDQFVQNGTTATMIFSVPFLVSYVSQFMTLLPGDVITTGTPPGVGMGFKPPRFLNPGDRTEVSITGLGRQYQTVTKTL
jgi:2,4-didehydro-3-deoxy-L-rhamnonate hydrolase